MKKFFVAGLTAFLALFTAACSVTPMFYMPAEEGDISKIPVDGLTGFWEDTAKHTTVEIRPLDKNIEVDFPHGFDVTWMLRDAESKPEMKKVSLIARPRKYHNERFMVCFLNTPKMLNEAKGYSAINLLMARPHIYLVKFDLNERWALGVGVNYSYLSRKFYGTYTKADENGVQISSTASDIRNSQHFIGIPVNAYCNIVNNKHVNLYAYAGGTVEKCVSDKYEVLSTSIVHTENPKGVQLSANIGLGVEFRLGQHLGLYVDPSLRYYFDNGQPKSIRTAQPLMLGFEMGLRVSL